MNRPDLHAMSLKELRAFILNNREDNDAFDIFMNRMRTERTWTQNPPLKSLEDMENYPDFLEKLKQDSGRCL